ncbi:hypothetical protein [Halomarina oriensis]|uniref:Uncharacterized protein n=1 Tax=Halomarina oriensis TaxID=671145 RepID=A0A6B0GJN4_9EURY|nr:hypothetical protein [Halomarina oriensis]MWG34047.1 hypothetical protein [Halomarina oriensis]
MLLGGCLVGYRTSDASDPYLSFVVPAFVAGGAGAALGSVLGLLSYQVLVPQFGAFVGTPVGPVGGPSGGVPFLGVLVAALTTALTRGTVVAGAAIAHDESPGATPLSEYL